MTDLGKKQGFVIAIDGRKLFVRSPHTTINQLLQGGGSIVCKMWMMETDMLMRKLGHTPDEDYGLMARVHDELQFECRPELIDVLSEVSSTAMVEVGKHLNFKGELATEAKIGGSWMECH